MKRALLIVALALFIQADGHTQAARLQWACSVDNQADSLALCAPAPEPGMRRYITDIVAQSTTTAAGLFNLQAAKAAALGGAPDCGAVDGLTLFPPGIDVASPGRFAAEANTLAATRVKLTNPLVVPAAKDLCVLGDATNPVTVQVTGYLAP